MSRGKQFYTRSDVGKRFGVSPSAVHYWVRADWLRPDATTVGGRPLFLTATVSRFAHHAAVKRVTLAARKRRRARGGK